MEDFAVYILIGFSFSHRHSKVRKFSSFNARSVWSNGLEVRVLDYQSRGSEFKTTGWLQGQFSISPFKELSNRDHEFLGSLRLKVNSLLAIALQP